MRGTLDLVPGGLGRLLVASGKLVQILVNENVLFDANMNRRDMFLFIFFRVVLVWTRAVAVSRSHRRGREWPTPSYKKIRCRHHGPVLLIEAVLPTEKPATDPPTSRPTYPRDREVPLACLVGEPYACVRYPRCRRVLGVMATTATMHSNPSFPFLPPNATAPAELKFKKLFFGPKPQAQEVEELFLVSPQNTNS